MGATRWFAILLLFAVPLAMWLALTGITQRGRRRVFSAVITGHDGRLSLSRLQAFVWTMIIAGAYCAAMAVHPRITINNAAERTALETAYKDASTALTAAETALREKETQAFARKVEWEAATESVRGAKGDALTQAVAANQAAGDAYRLAAREVSIAKRAHANARRASDSAKLAWRRSQWVRIPNELLALAGITLATGIFASVISASGDAPQSAPPSVTGVTVANNQATITGTSFGTTGEVRLNGRALRDPQWSDTQIVVDIDPKVTPKRLTVDSPNGKKVYKFAAGWTGAFTEVSELEWRDLLREDSNPGKFSLTKFQMLGWTGIAVFFFLVILVRNLNESIDALPTVDATVVLLTGLSNSGYLGGKAAAKP